MLPEPQLEEQVGKDEARQRIIAVTDAAKAMNQFGLRQNKARHL